MEDTTAYDETMPTADLDELLQEEPEFPVVKVVLAEAALTHELPARYAVAGTDLVGDTAFTPLVSGSDKHKSIVIVSYEEPIFISPTGTGGMLWPAKVPYTATHAKAVQVMCATAAATTRVGWTIESWAD